MSRQSKAFDLSVYFVADSSLCVMRDVVDIVQSAVCGGVTMIQLRNKSGDEQAFLEQALACKAVLQGSDVPFLINDNVEIALKIEADGVHLGQGDMDPAKARAILGPDKIVGLTAFTKMQIGAVDPDIVDYIGTGPFYETQTKKGKPVLGKRKFQELVELSPVPVVGIGGIEPENAACVINAGAQGVAMMRSVSEARDPQNQAQRFVQEITRLRLEAVL